MTALVVVIALLLYVPVRVLKPFPASVKGAAWMIVVVKTAIIMWFHFYQIDTGNHPIVLDQSIDAKKYYDVAAAMSGIPLLHLRHDDVAQERGAGSHLGYYYMNIYAFHICPKYPILFLRLFKLFAFSTSMGLIATVWLKRTGSVARASFGYFLLTIGFYQFIYYTFRNFKDDIILSMFVTSMALVDGYLINPDRPRSQKKLGTVVLAWAAVGILVYFISTMRFYAGLAIVCGLAAHTVIGPGMKISTRVITVVVFLVGFAGLMATSGGRLVSSAGGFGTMLTAAGDLGGLFKILVTPVPWQHPIGWHVPGHLLYLLFLLPVALIAFFTNIRECLDWKLVVVMLLTLVVGGYVHDFTPRKRYMMYPVFTSWIVMMGTRRRVDAEEPEAFDVDAYYTRQSAWV